MRETEKISDKYIEKMSAKFAFNRQQSRKIISTVTELLKTAN